MHDKNSVVAWKLFTLTPIEKSAEKESLDKENEIQPAQIKKK